MGALQLHRMGDGRHLAHLQVSASIIHFPPSESIFRMLIPRGKRIHGLSAFCELRRTWHSRAFGGRYGLCLRNGSRTKTRSAGKRSPLTTTIISRSYLTKRTLPSDFTLSLCANLGTPALVGGFSMMTVDRNAVPNRQARYALVECFNL